VTDEPISDQKIGAIILAVLCAAVFVTIVVLRVIYG
jgi:hypothetical protein